MLIRIITITETNQMNIAEDFGVTDDFDEMLPIGDVILFDSDEYDPRQPQNDYDIIQIFNN